MKTHLLSERTFQLWEYRVSHGSLLIRSPKGPDTKTNVDIVFAGVEYVAAPRFFQGLEITGPTGAEIHQLEQIVNKHLPASNIHVLVVSGRRHLIVAAAMKVDENENDIFDSPFDC